MIIPVTPSEGDRTVGKREPIPTPQIVTQVENPELVRQKHQQLIEAGTRLFERQGFHNTTVPEIAREAGWSIGSIYRYVEKKEDIMLLSVSHLLDLYEREIEPAVSGASDPVDKLRRAIEGYYQIIDREQAKTLLAYRDTWSLGREARRFVMQRELETNRIFQRIIDEGVATGAFRPVDSELFAYNIIMLGHMWALKRWRLPGRLSIDQYIAQQTDTILRALRADPE